MSKIERSIRKIIKNNDYSLFKRLLTNTFYMLRSERKDCLLVNASMFVVKDSVEHFNIGDDLNFYMFKELTGKKLFNFNDVFNVRKLPVYLCIGSILNAKWIKIKNCIIWGAGARNTHNKLNGKPLRILAVRGPLTRNYLLSQNIDCPPIYGDPTLLLPKIYNPQNMQKKYKLGIIPHMYDRDNPIITELLRKNKDIVFIDVKHYDDWKNFIDKIVECDFIISSSLHGIIISDAYHVPNQWIKFLDETYDGPFKYLDYFASVLRDVKEPLVMHTGITLQEIMSCRANYQHIKIDLEQLWDTCPFRSHTYENRI